MHATIMQDGGFHWWIDPDCEARIHTDSEVQHIPANTFQQGGVNPLPAAPPWDKISFTN